MPPMKPVWNPPSADWPSVLIHGLVALALAFVFYLVFVGLDYLTGTDRTRRCLVEDKRCTPASTEIRTETEYGFDGQLNLVSHVEYIPEAYTLRVCVDGQGTNYVVDAARYASVHEGQTIDLVFRYGGMTGVRY
jgi:hypothetical protein